MDDVYALNEMVQGKLMVDKPTYTFFLDVQKAYDTVWRDGLWSTLWDMGEAACNNKKALSVNPQHIHVHVYRILY